MAPTRPGVTGDKRECSHLFETIHNSVSPQQNSQHQQQGVSRREKVKRKTNFPLSRARQVRSLLDGKYREASAGSAGRRGGRKGSASKGGFETGENELQTSVDRAMPGP